MKPNRIIVAGSRTFANYTLLDHKLTHILQRLTPADTAILSGCARGADQLAEHWAWAHGYDVLRFPANWNELGKRAGYLRNEEMARQATWRSSKWLRSRRKSRRASWLSSPSMASSSLPRRWRRCLTRTHMSGSCRPHSPEPMG